MAINVRYEEIAKILDEHEHWFILSHVKPDGDTLGSACALFCAGKERGKRVSWGGPSEVPVHYGFLPHIENYEKSGWIDLASFGKGREPLFVCLDTSTTERTVGGLHQFWEILNIDHHPDNQRYGTYCHIQPKISSVSEIIWDFLTKQGWNISNEAALGLYTGIMTDSGSFSYNSTSVSTHIAAGDLLVRGVEPSAVSLAVNGNKTVQGFHLWGTAMSRVRLICNNEVAFTHIALGDFYSTGAAQSDTEFLVNQMLLIRGVKLAVLISEDVMETRVSLRSVLGGLSAGKIARQLGGGGHELAAGVRIEKSVREVIPAVLARVEREYAGRNTAA